jgi:hypothetical protein
MHEKDDRPLTASSSLNLQRMHERSAMSKDATLVGGAFEEFRHLGIVSVRQNSNIRKVFGEKVLRPEEMRCSSAVRPLSVFGLLLSREQLRYPTLRICRLFLFLAVCPCLLWVALNAVDEHEAVKCGSAIMIHNQGRTTDSATGSTPLESTVNPSSRTLTLAI